MIVRSNAVVAGAVTLTLALALTGCAPNTPTSTATNKSSHHALTKSTPAPAADVVLRGAWQTFDRVLISADIFGSTTAALKPDTTEVPIYVPGDGLHTVKLSVDLGSGEVQRQSVNVGGADGSLLLIVATTTRIPAHGLDKDEAHNQLDSYSVATGKHVATYAFADSEDEGLEITTIAATRGDSVAVDFNYSYLGKSITGVNMRTGKKTWDDTSVPALATRSIDGTSYGTFATSSDTSGHPGDASSCYRSDGFETSTGQMLWSVDSATIPDTGYPSDCSNVGTETLDQGRGSGGAGAYFQVVLGMSSGTGDSDQYRTYDGVTGKQLASANIEGYIDLLGQYSAEMPGDGIRGPLVVTSIATGQTVYSVGVQKQDDLNLQLEGIFGGYLYLKTTDGTPIIDVATGKVVADNTTNMPIQTVGAYTLYTDGTLSLNAHLGAK